MSRNTRRRQQDASAALIQLRNTAFTIRGHAMEDRLESRERYEVICAYPSGGSYKSALSKARSEGRLESFYRNGAAFSDRELGEPEPGVKRWLVVGYASREPDEKSLQKKCKAQSGRVPFGTVIPPDLEVLPWDDENPPVFVVAEILSQLPGGEATQLYALTNPKNGLCTPCQIGQDCVFYRSEFRDLSTEIGNRGRAWNKLVQEQSIKPDINTAPLTHKQEVFRRAKDSVKLVFSPTISLANEIASLAANFDHTNDMYFIEEIKTELLAADNDLKYRPRDNQALRLFADDEENEFSSAQAQEFVDEFCSMWPDHPEVTPERVMWIKEEMIKGNIFIEYRLLRPVVVEVCFRMATKDMESPGRGLLEDTIETARRMFGTYEMAPLISETDRNATIALIVVKLKEIQAAGALMEEELKGGFGESAFNGTIQDVWAHYANAADTDTARAAFMQASKAIFTAVRHKERGLKGMVDDLVLVVEKLKL